MDDRRVVAARNNAAWCDLVCRSRDATTRLDDRAWSTPTRAPQLYPDAVSLVPDLLPQEVLGRVDESPGCSIKDSFAALDLAPDGFRPLFDAQWVTRDAGVPAPGRGSPVWEVVEGSNDLARWLDAWRGDDPGTSALHVDLLGHDSVTVLAARRGTRIEAGAILNHAVGVQGLSNLFARTGDLVAAWAGCVAVATTLFPGVRLVGYEAGDDLMAALAAGFTAIGPLRVWLRD